MSQTRHKDQGKGGKGGKGNSVYWQRTELPAQPLSVAFRVTPGAGAAVCPTAPSEISLARPLQGTMSS